MSPSGLSIVSLSSISFVSFSSKCKTSIDSPSVARPPPLPVRWELTTWKKIHERTPCERKNSALAPDDDEGGRWLYSAEKKYAHVKFFSHLHVYSCVSMYMYMHTRSYGLWSSATALTYLNVINILCGSRRSNSRFKASHFDQIFHLHGISSFFKNFRDGWNKKLGENFRTANDNTINLRAMLEPSFPAFVFMVNQPTLHLIL